MGNSQTVVRKRRRRRRNTALWVFWTVVAVLLLAVGAFAALVVHMMGPQGPTLAVTRATPEPTSATAPDADHASERSGPAVVGGTSSDPFAPAASEPAPAIAPSHEVAENTPPAAPVTTPTTAPKPVPQQPAAPPEAPPITVVPSAHTSGMPVGISVADRLTGLNAEELNAQLNDMVSLGFTWVRLDFDWSWMERDRGNVDWVKLDRVVDAARAHGLSLLPILAYTPVWARSDGCESSPRCHPKDPAAFAAFAAAAAARYAPKGVHAWEIWNEENMRGTWLPEAEPEQYKVLLEQAYAAIKHVDPSAIVITGGLGPIASGDGNLSPLDYLTELYAAGAQGHFDAVGFHPYSFPVLPDHEAPWNAWQQMAATERSARSIMQDNGDGGKKIWITEYGAPTGGPGRAASYDTEYAGSAPDHVTEDLQAKMIAQAVREARTDPWVGALFIYTYHDPSADTSTVENFFGIVRYDGTHKPAYDALHSLLAGS